MPCKARSSAAASLPRPLVIAHQTGSYRAVNPGGLRLLTTSLPLALRREAGNDFAEVLTKEFVFPLRYLDDDAIALDRSRGLDLSTLLEVQQLGAGRDAESSQGKSMPATTRARTRPGTCCNRRDFMSCSISSINDA